MGNNLSSAKAGAGARGPTRSPTSTLDTTVISNGTMVSRKTTVVRPPIPSEEELGNLHHIS